MKQFCRITIVSILFSFVSSLSLEADEYKIYAVSSDRILIGNKYAKKGMIFTDNDKIVWPSNDKTASMRLRNLTKHCWVYRPPRSKNKTSGGIIFGSKGSGQVETDTLPMIDSLIIDLHRTDYKAIRFEARWIGKDYKDKYVILPYAKGQKEIFITREMLDISIGETRDIEIWIWKGDDDEGCLWKEITVEVVPLIKMK